MKRVILFSVSTITISLLFAFRIYYSRGCAYHSGSPADGLTCASCHSGGIITPSISITFVPSIGSDNTYIPGTTYTIYVTGQGYNLFGFDLEILNSTSPVASNVSDFGTIKSISSNETINSFNLGIRTYSDIMHTAPNANPFKLEWTAPNGGTGYLYCALLGINNSGNSSGDKVALTTMTLNPSISTEIEELKNHINEEVLSVYPNPCSEVMNITYKVEGTKLVNVELFNFSGKKLLDIYHGENVGCKKNIQYLIPTSLPKGTYLIKLSIDKQQLMTRKVILK
jgi:hypothetical protein